MRSLYRWQGAIEVADERQVIVKTTRARLAAVQAALFGRHPRGARVPGSGGGGRRGRICSGCAPKPPEPGRPLGGVGGQQLSETREIERLGEEVRAELGGLLAQDGSSKPDTTSHCVPGLLGCESE